MSAPLDDLAVLHDEYDIRVADGRKAVGDHDRGPTVDDRVDRALDLLLSDRIDRGRGLIEHQDARIGQDRAGKGDELLFACREHVAALAHVGLQPLFEPGDHLVRGDELQSPFDLLVRGFGLGVEQVFPHRAGKQMRRLKHIADRAVQPELRALARVAAVDEHAARRRLVEAADEVGERRLACARLADDGDVRPEGDLQVEMLQNVFVAVGILEADVAELDITAQALPVLPFRLKAVAVALDDRLGVVHVRLRFEQLCQTLDVDLRGHEIRKGVHQPADGLHHALRVGHEHREGADLALCDKAAAPEHDGKRKRGGEVHRHGEHAAQTCRAHRTAAHVVGLGAEIMLDPILDHQRFDRFRAGDALVEVAGDPRVDLADLAVGAHEMLLEDREQQHQQRQDREHHQRQTRVDDEHGDDRADHVGALPYAVDDRPGEQRADARGVGHDARVDVADAVLVEIGEGQRLQMLKGRVAQILVEPHLKPQGPERGEIVGHAVEGDHKGVNQNKWREGIERAQRDEVVERVALQQRRADVDHAAADREEHHHRHHAAVLFQIGQHLADAEEFQRGFGFGGRVHTCASFTVPDWIS